MELKDNEDIKARIVYGSWVIASIVFFALFLISYFGTPAEYNASQIPLGIPANAEKVENTETATEIYQGISYGAGKDVEFVPIKVNNPMLFKTGFDKVYFSVNYEKYSGGGENKNKVAVSMIGIRYNELPRTYEYSNSLYILPKELSGPFNWYEKNGFTVSEKSPWIVTGNYRKNTLVEGVIVSFVASIVLGIFAAAIVLVVVELILYLGKKKEFKS